MNPRHKLKEPHDHENHGNTEDACEMRLQKTKKVQKRVGAVNYIYFHNVIALGHRSVTLA